MSNRIWQVLYEPKKVLLASGAAALAGALVIGVGHVRTIRAESHAPQQDSGMGSKERPLVFDAVSIKPYSGGGGRGRGSPDNLPPRDLGGGAIRFLPGRVVTMPGGVTARKIILEAFHLSQYQLSGGPSWVDSSRFDLEAKAEGANESQLRQMLQSMLTERFKLVVHSETKEMPVYALVVGKNGPKLHEWKDGDRLPEFGSGGHANNFRDLGPIQRLADVLSANPEVGRPVLDKTGLKGVYVFYVEWDYGDDFLSTVQEQFGLKLQSQRGPVDSRVIDHIEKPEANRGD